MLMQEKTCMIPIFSHNAPNKENKHGGNRVTETYIFSPACPSLSLSVPINLAPFSIIEAEIKQGTRHIYIYIYTRQQFP